MPKILFISNDHGEDTIVFMRVFLVRHASPVMPGTTGYSEISRPLTELGFRDAVALAQSLESEQNIMAVYSSPMLRAVQTVEPLASARGLAVLQIPDLVEHALAPEPIANWQEVLQKSWLAFDFSLLGGETMRQTQTRGLKVLEQVVKQHPTGDVVIGGHGTIFSLILHGLGQPVDFTFHLAMPMPALYRLEFEDGILQRVLGHGF
jgi:2,3-bisphosphoglycerate-dependent phosphoglycerate mutase